MSADFFSYVCWRRSASARRLFEALRECTSVVEDVVDPNGSAVFDPSGKEPFMPLAVAARFRGKPPELNDFATAYADIGDAGGDDVPLLEELGKWSKVVMSPNFPAIVVVDRVLAIPNGVSFMRGQAVARLRPKAVRQLAAEWPVLLERIGGEEKAANRVSKYLDRFGNGYEDASEMLSAINHGVRVAAEGERDMLLVGIVVP